MTDRDNEKMTQIAAQCRAIVHMAMCITQLHLDKACMFSNPACNDAMTDIADIVGERTASFMEQLGDMLNAMDAVTEDDEWLTPIFEEAQRRWPTKDAQP
jgi:hypothetical protein